MEIVVKTCEKNIFTIMQKNLLVQRITGAIVVLVWMLLTVSVTPGFAQTNCSIKVQVSDAATKPVGGEPVTLYGDPPCQCVNTKCAANIITTQNTKAKGDKTPGPTGQTEFNNLDCTKTYTVAIRSTCLQLVTPCTNNADCKLATTVGNVVSPNYQTTIGPNDFKKAKHQVVPLTTQGL